MSARTEAMLRKLFAASPVAETDHYSRDGVTLLRRKGLIRSERAVGNYWRWRHELTSAGMAERARMTETARG